MENNVVLVAAGNDIELNIVEINLDIATVVRIPVDKELDMVRFYSTDRIHTFTGLMEIDDFEYANEIFYMEPGIYTTPVQIPGTTDMPVKMAVRFLSAMLYNIELKLAQSTLIEILESDDRSEYEEVLADIMESHGEPYRVPYCVPCYVDGDDQEDWINDPHNDEGRPAILLGSGIRPASAGDPLPVEVVRTCDNCGHSYIIHGLMPLHGVGCPSCDDGFDLLSKIAVIDSDAFDEEGNDARI